MSNSEKKTKLYFNQKSRVDNSLKSSVVSVVCNVANIIFGLLYRTIFVYVLGAAYLGINGLFTSVLSVLSLAELGITTAIVYRLYKPISMNDPYKVGQIMCFFKWVYRAIAFIVLLAGLAIVPILPFLIKDGTEIPGDINIYVIYCLFLLQSASTYMFSYRLSILNADQRGYTFSVVQLSITLAGYIVQATVLIIFQDFTLALTSAVVTNLLVNFILSRWVTAQYPEVFSVKDILEKKERKEIYSDVYATACHQFGFVALNATDNIVLSSFVGIVATGMYSNYYLVTSSLTTLASKMLGSFVGSLGNAHVLLSDEENYLVFRRLVFANFSLTSLFTICTFILIDGFISLWLGPDLLLDKLAVIAQCVYFFLALNRIINGVFINSFGLFVKDKIRPLIEALVNVFVSIALVQIIGISGVFFGTALSFLVTIFWREPYLLHKHVFKNSMKNYWIRYAQFALLTFVLCFFDTTIKGIVGFELSWFSLIIEGLVCASVFVLFLVLLFFRTAEYRFYKELLATRIFHR